MSARHTMAPPAVWGTSALIRGVQDRIEALKQAGEAPALKFLLSKHLHGIESDAAVLAGSPEARGVLSAIDAMILVLRRRYEFVDLEELLSGELEDLKIETLARTPGGLDHYLDFAARGR